MKETKLTSRQREVMDAIRAAVRENGLPPSRRELARAVGGHDSAISGHLKALARKGWIKLLPGVDRGIRLLREGIPILDGTHLPAVAAGGLRDTEESQNLARLSDLESVLAEFDSRPELFVRVEGATLHDAGFVDGDVVAVCLEHTVQDGDVVLTQVGPEVKLKHVNEASTITEDESPKALETIAKKDVLGVVVGAIIKRRRPKGLKK